MRNEISPSKIGKRIRKIREESGLRPSEVARKMGITRQMFYYIEKGERSLTVSRLRQLSDIFNVDINDVLGRKASNQKKTA